MFSTTVLITCTIFTACEKAKQVETPIKPVANQRELIERIVATGGDAEHSGGFIINVSLRDAEDKDFVLLKDLRGVKFLDCAYCKIDGSGFKYIQQMKRLEYLWLHDNQFDEQYLRYIRDFPRLHTLFLDNTSISDAGLRHLQNLKALERLYLDQTQISDEGLRHLRKLTALKILDLSETKVDRTWSAGSQEISSEYKNLVIIEVAAFRPNLRCAGTLHGHISVDRSTAPVCALFVCNSGKLDPDLPVLHEG